MADVEIIKMTPDELGYKDRGIMKWQGLILASHRDGLDKMDKGDKQGKPQAKEQMSEIEISEYLQQSYLNKRPVSIQANVLRDGHFYPDVNCIIVGFQDEDIYLLLNDNRSTTCTLDQIRNIEFMDPQKWYNK